MTGLLNIISRRLSSVDFSNPLTFIDLAIAILLVLSFLFYLRKFPVFRVVLGILFLFICSLAFLLIDFIYTALVFGVVSNLILISLPLIFAPEIRHYLEKLGRFPFLKIPKITVKQRKVIFINHLIDAVYELTEEKIGGTIVIARKTGIGETIETGTIIDAVFSSKLLKNIFYPKSPLHDGAVIIKNDRIVAAGCLLPLSPEVRLDPPYGTRHKSGLAITKDTDVVVLLISEQRNEVSLAENGKLKSGIDRPELAERLMKLL